MINPIPAPIMQKMKFYHQRLTSHDDRRPVYASLLLQLVISKSAYFLPTLTTLQRVSPYYLYFDT
jgi:hypothetical protein